MKITFATDREIASEFQYFWAMAVSGFDSRHHCQKCFRGRKFAAVNPRVAPGAAVSLIVAPGEWVYFCGVSHTFRHDRNFHLAGKVVAGSGAARLTFAGATVRVSDLEAVEIRPEAARELFPDRDWTYLTCRNFQFAAQVFGSGTPGRSSSRKQAMLF